MGVLMIYTYKDGLNDFLFLFNNVELVHKRGTKKNYYNIALSFDIETSSIYIDNDNNTISNPDFQKVANMYIWQLAFNNNVIYGRYWTEFLDLMKKLTIKLNTDNVDRLIIYVHNLSYEFQFIYKMFKWFDVFAISERKPIYALTSTGIEFRCSFILSGYNLDTLAKNLQNKSIKKLVGDLDYSLIRHNETPLTDLELQYCFNDTLIVTHYINEQIEEYGDISKIPYTQTGKVRNFVKKNCFSLNPNYKYFIKDLKLSVLEYKKLQLCYSGGFTHSNSINTGVTISNVTSYDFTSSYPYVMLSEKYPMSTGRKIKINSNEQFEQLLKNYCCLFTIHLENIKPKTYNENILQFSKCYNVKKPILNNGRIVECESCDIVVNEIDFYNINLFYNYSLLDIYDFYIYEKGYLPKEIIESILTLYEMKTTLKGVEGKEKEYLHSKEMLNSVYGMCVTNTMKENIIFNGREWVKNENFNLSESIKNYNEDRGRFLFYPWGVWVTSYARRNLLSGIISVGKDYVYADTDSIKLTNRENHLEYFDTYNKNVKIKLKNMCDYYHIDYNRCKPKTIKGVEKLIGVWDFEGVYKNFKTLGAKRYIVQKDNGDYEITVAGLSKKAVYYIIEESKKQGVDVFTFFNNYMYVPTNKTYKNTHTYIDNEYICNITDYTGKTKKVMCKSGVHLTPCDFTLSLSDMYLKYIIQAKNIIDMK